MAGVPLELVSLADIAPIAEPEETGTTFEENARLKARYYAERSGLPTVAEDSGLVIDALDGEPGVRSARFLRPDASYPERFAEIFRRLDERPEEPRTARFVAALACVDNGQVIYETTGVVEGEIAMRPEARAGSATTLSSITRRTAGRSRKSARPRRWRRAPRRGVSRVCRLAAEERGLGGTMNGEHVVLRSSPRVWPRTVFRPGIRRAGRLGPSVLRLVRQELHRPAWQVNFSQVRAARA